MNEKQIIGIGIFILVSVTAWGIFITNEPIEKIKLLSDEVSSDKIRATDLDNMAGAINFYNNTIVTEEVCECKSVTDCECYDTHDWNKPAFPKADNYTDLVAYLTDWQEAHGMSFKLRDDPSYFYATNDANSPTEYVLKTVLSSEKSIVFENDEYVFSRNRLLPSGEYLGLDCHRPSYCLGSKTLFKRLDITMPGEASPSQPAKQVATTTQIVPQSELPTSNVPSKTPAAQLPETKSPSQPTQAIDYGTFSAIRYDIFANNPPAYVGSKVRVKGIINGRFLAAGDRGGGSNYIQITDPNGYTTTDVMLKIPSNTNYQKVVEKVQPYDLIAAYGTGSTSESFTIGGQQVLLPIIVVTRLDSAGSCNPYGCLQTSGTIIFY